MKLGIALVVLVGLLPLARAQQAATSSAVVDPCAAQSRASFDVATVKPSGESAGDSSMNTRLNSMSATMTARRLIENAYGLRDFQVSGGPGWVNDASWEVQAKIDPPEPSNLDEAGRKAVGDRERQRLQSLLADRFQLKCHMTTKELPVYELVQARTGSKLTHTTAPDDKTHFIHSNGNARKVEFNATGISMTEAATSFSDAVGRTVIEKTGLTGSYDLQLTYAPAMSTGQDADAATGPTIFTALEEQAGLKLVSAKGPVQVLVIDSIEKPSEN
jgi:uncharacterized protein (TIGR03435 family)